MAYLVANKASRKEKHITSEGRRNLILAVAQCFGFPEIPISVLAV